MVSELYLHIYGHLLGSHVGTDSQLPQNPV